MGWHRNHAISHSPNQNFFEDTFVSHPGGPNEQFGTHEKLSWGGGGVQGNLNWMLGYKLMHGKWMAGWVDRSTGQWERKDKLNFI